MPSGFVKQQPQAAVWTVRWQERLPSRDWHERTARYKAGEFTRPDSLAFQLARSLAIKVSVRDISVEGSFTERWETE